MDMFTPQGPTLEDIGLPIKLEGPEGDDYKERIESASRFEELGLRDPILQAIYWMGYKKPSHVQATALPLIMGPNRPSLLCQSQTGTGKTACFALAMIHRIDTSRDVPQALIVAPTRELARQIITYINRVCQREVDVVTALAVPGGFDKNRPFDAHIIVGTPGTVVECLRRKLIDPTHMNMLVMDEADNLLDMQGLGDHAIRVKRYMPADIQVLLFSATFSDTVLTFADSFAPGALRMTVPRHELTMNGIKQVYIDLNSEEEKYRILVELYHTMCVGSSIIFCKRRDEANKIAARMREDGHKVAVLHAALDSVAARDEVIDGFRRGLYKVLITTNVLARGIDVETTSLVINYDLPHLIDGTPDYVTYLHRIGRTGRFGRSGVSVAFVHDKQSWNDLQDIQNYFGVPIHLIPGDQVDVIEVLMKRIIKNNAEIAARYGAMENSRHAPASVKTGLFDNPIGEANILR